MKDVESLRSITLRIPQRTFDWLDKHHWCAKTSRSGFASDLLVEAVEAEMPAHQDEE